MSSQVAKLLDTFSSALLGQGPLDFGSAMRAMEGHMDAISAMKVVAHKNLPQDVQNMVQLVSSGKGNASGGFGFAQDFSEESLAKARLALNELIEKAWKVLDDKIMECKGFEDRYVGQYGVVTRDIARLIQQINDLERVESEAVEGIQTKDGEIKTAEDLLEKETQDYMEEYTENSHELTKHQNDMDVFQFIMEFTKCKDATSLSQVKVCQTSSGKRVFSFDDDAQNEKYHKLLTPKVEREVDRLLRSMAPPTSLLQLEQAPVNNTEPPVKVAKAPVKDGMSSIEASLACAPDTVPDCALLHDKLSLMWGEFKDQVDELTMIMMKNEYEFNELKTNINNQIEVLKAAKARLNELLGEARANLAADNEELKQKNIQERKMGEEYHKKMAACKKRINWIFYQDMCAIKLARNAVLENSTVCSPDGSLGPLMIDCDMGPWVPGQCTVSCDDSCQFGKQVGQTPEDAAKTPFKCGGWQMMTREAVVESNECGVQCPHVYKEMYQRCGQFHCPIDCVMSEWSGWSKCSAECNGGVQGHTRSIVMKPKNGGMSCNTVEESRPCGTISCDRNCRLSRWTDWSPCSMACGGGFREKFRHVALPTRGFGKCPGPSSKFRYRKGPCNEQACTGDEICVAKQDLIVAVDGSGSIREKGFDTLKAFVKKLLSRYQTEYWGDEAVKLGIVLFGNGVIMEDGKTVSPARLEKALTFDMAAVEAAVEAMPFKKGFTNMAQAFSTAENAFIQGSRRGAQSAVMVITDGRPSFNFMTNEMVEQLDDKGITRYFLIINEQDLSSDGNRLMKAWASQPWETNLVHVPGGLTLLESDPDMWADKALVKFCPMAYSPSDMEWEEINYGYAHVKDGAWCGEKLEDNLLTADAESAETCAALVSGVGGHSFILGTSWARGKCYMGTVDVDMDQFTAWQKNRVNPECPEANGGWRSSTLFDFYAMEPVAE